MEFVTQFLRENWLVLLVLGGLAIAWMVFRTQGTDLESTEAFDQRVSAGQPVVVEFYSNT